MLDHAQGWADRTSEAWHGTTLSRTADAERAGLTQSMGNRSTVERGSIKPSTTQSLKGTHSIISPTREARTASVDSFWWVCAGGWCVCMRKCVWG